jgi:hypothetical protein
MAVERASARHAGNLAGIPDPTQNALKNRPTAGDAF